jgi:threonine/homoserine/homoserine lactone efflux protein
MISYSLAVFFLLITPGPGVLTVAGVGSAYGFRLGLAYALGVVLGSLLVMAAVTTGLAAFLLSYPPLRSVLLAGSGAYLLYIAFRIAATGSTIAIVEAPRPLGAFAGVAFSIINPKAYVVMATLFSGFPFHPHSHLIESALKAIVFVCFSIPVHMIWLYAGATLKRLALSAEINRAINIAMAIAMVAVVALAALS